MSAQQHIRDIQRWVAKYEEMVQENDSLKRRIEWYGQQQQKWNDEIKAMQRRIANGTEVCYYCFFVC